MKIFFALALLLFLSRCDTNPQKISRITILNSSTQLIDSIRITSYGLDTLFTNLLPNKEMTKNILINYSGEIQGAFLANIYIKGVEVKQGTFGYFNSGRDIHSAYQIEITREFEIKEKKR